jgi:predicted CXXCH cytochrome family protein
MAPVTGARRRRRRAVWPRLALILVLIGSLSYLGCGTEERYKVLSFFFDGVPKPGEENKPPPPKGPWGLPVEPGSAAAKEFPVAQATPGPAMPPPPVSEHAPYRNRDCFSCHETESSMAPATSGAALCRKCHAAYLDPPMTDWVHGPAALGQCSLCHVSHKSQFPALLAKAQRDLCLRCHVEPGLLEEPYHKAAAAKDCSACHDPHMAGNRLLLVDSGSFTRRKVERNQGSEHAPWKDRKCTTCHVPEQSNALVAEIDKICLSCHQKTLEGLDAKKTHQAVRDGKCSVCHSGHKSPRPHLVRPTAEQICYACHKPDDVRKPGHPPVERADCLLCHKGHTSDRRFLLKEDIPLPKAPPPNLTRSSEPDHPHAAPETKPAL